MLKKLPLAAAAVLLCGTLARAQTDPNAVIAPYLDAQTLVVGHLDVAALDTAAIEKYVASLIDTLKFETPTDAADAKKALAESRRLADASLARFKSLGGRHLYLLINHQDLFPNMDPRALLIAVEGGPEKTPAMLEFLKGIAQNEHGVTTAQLTPTLLFIGAPAALERLKSLTPAPRPELALTTGDNAPPLQLVAALSPDLRRVLSEMLPTLPPDLGTASVADLASFSTLSLNLTLPPKPALTLQAYYTSEPHARALAATIEKARDALLAHPEFNKQLDQPELKPMANDLREFLKSVLTPAVAGLPAMGKDVWLVNLTLNDAHLKTLSRTLVPAIARAREQSRRVQSMSNLRQLTVAIILYANDNKDALPESLEPALQLAKTPKAVALHPANGKPYIYKRWTPVLSQLKNPSETPILWEDVAAGAEGLNVAFADGHVEWMKADDFKKRLADTEAWAKPLTPANLP